MKIINIEFTIKTIHKSFTKYQITQIGTAKIIGIKIRIIGIIICLIISITYINHVFFLPMINCNNRIQCNNRDYKIQNINYYVHSYIGIT